MRKYLSKLKRSIKHGIRQLYYRRSIFLLGSLPVFAPSSGGNYRTRARLAVHSAKKTFLVFGDLLNELYGEKYTVVSSAEAFCRDIMQMDPSETIALKDVFDAYGSDKSTTHNYHFIYAPILHSLRDESLILEIGLGTNNIDVVSHMGERGRPGASLRAFKEYAPRANIFGADIDKRVLFSEDRIKTYFVDQTNPDSFTYLEEQISEKLDLIIDDGLHAPQANINTLAYALRSCRPGGWIVIEDIPERSVSVWHAVAGALPKELKMFIVATESSYAFVVNKQDV
ncbi:MAG: class I SAM-dependent methyltransferase [Candidatus Paceibacterota bacterium]